MLFDSPCRLLILVLVLACGNWGRAQTLEAPEYEVKAAFLYNFGKFVEWPVDAFKEGGDHLVIGILGEDPFGRVLDKLVENRLVQGKQVEVRRFKSNGDFTRCHILFVSLSEARSLPEILKRIASAPVLTVSDLPNFLERGGNILLFVDQEKVRFAINRKSAEHAGLKIGSQLLRIAQSARE